MQIGNFKISPEKYQEWLKKLTSWFNNSGRAEETLERHLDNIQRLYNEGGILYRLMFLERGETIDKNNLGQHWVADEDVLADIRNMLLDTAKAEKDPDYEYTITIKIPPKNINIHDSISDFLENPNEEEIYLNNTRNAKIQDIQKTPLAETIIRRRLANLTESNDFISGVDTVNMKDYAKAAIRDIFIQMPSRSVNLNNWNGYKNYVSGFFGKDSYKVAMRELKEDGWLTKGETRYEWKKMYGPVGTFPQKDHLNENKSLEETPDFIGTTAQWGSYDAFSFGYFKDVLYASDGTHRNTWVDVGHDTYDRGVPRGKFKYAGRIWMTKDILSFWKYPEDSNKMKQVCDDLTKWFKSGWEEQSEENVDTDSKKMLLGKNYDIWNKFNVEIVVNKSGEIDTDVEYDELNNIVGSKKYTNEIIPVKDYHTSEERSSAELSSRHISSPMSKSSEKIAKGIGSRKTLAGLTPTKYHQLRSTSESADVFKHPDTGNKVWFDFGGVAFGYIDGDMEISKYNGTHGDIVNAIFNKYEIVYKGNVRDKFKYPGRIWPSEKIISFWFYPKIKNELYGIVKDLEDMLDTKIDSDYRIEIRDETGYKFVYINDYQGSKEIAMSDLHSGHMLSPAYKHYTKVPPGWGSRRTPADLSTSQRYQIKSTSENKLNEIQTEFGCLMLKIELPWWRDFAEKYIKDEDVYNNAKQEYGREYNSHVTILYGFNEGVDVEKMKKMLNTLKRPISIELTKIDVFKTKIYDVVKFDVISKMLNKLNEIVIQNFEYTETFKDYKPHITIGYVKPGEGDKYIKNLNMPISVSSATFIYSYPGGKKEVFNILKSE